jgi:hypothetical protein
MCLCVCHLSSASAGGSASSEQFARDFAIMVDKVDAAEALVKLAKDKFTAANQEHKDYSVALNKKLKEQKKVKAELVTRAALVKAAGDDPRVVEMATAIEKSTHYLPGIMIQHLKNQEIAGEISQSDPMLQAVILVESDMAERAAYNHAKDETAQAQAHFDQSKATLLELEAKKKQAAQKLEQLRKGQLQLMRVTDDSNQPTVSEPTESITVWVVDGVRRHPILVPTDTTVEEFKATLGIDESIYLTLMLGVC